MAGIKHGSLLFFLGLLFTCTLAQQPKLVLPIGHSSRIYGVAFSPNGKMIASVGHDQIVRVWSAEDGKLISSYTGHEDFITSVTFSKDNKQVASISAQDKAIKIWNIESGIQVKNFIDNKFWGSFVTYSPDNRKIVATSRAGVTVWDIQSGQPVFACQGVTKGNYEFAFLTPNQQHLITFSRGYNRFEGMVTVWEVASNKKIFEVNGDLAFETEQCLSAAADEITISDKGVIKTYNIFSGKLIDSLNEVTQIRERVTNLSSSDYIDSSGNVVKSKIEYDREIVEPVYSPDNRFIAASTLYYEYSTFLWDRQTKKRLSEFNEIKGGAPKFSADGKKLMTMSQHWNKLYIWDPGTKKLIAEIDLPTRRSQHTFSPDGKKILTADDDGRLRLYNADNGQFLFNMGSHTNFYVDKLYFSTDKKKLFMTTNDTKSVWDINSGALLLNVNLYNTDSTFRNLVYGRTRSATCRGTTVEVWDNEKNKLLQTIQGKYIKKPDGWVVKGYRRLKETSEQEHFYSAEISPTGTEVVTRSDDTAARIWNIKTGNISAELIGHTDDVRTAVYSKDGKYIITSSTDKTARIWNAQTGEELKVLKGHTDGLLTASIVAETGNIRTTAYDFTMKIWSFSSGQLLYTIRFNVLNNILTKGQKLITYYDEIKKDTLDKPDSLILANLKGFKGQIGYAQFHFTNDGKKLALAEWQEAYAENKDAVLYDVINNKIDHVLKGHTLLANHITYLPNEKEVITTSYDHTLKRWDAATGKLLYTFIVVDSNDYLVVDKHNRFDGTEAARKLLYFACGTEIIELNQLKDQLWVPNLAKRIVNHDSINAKTLDQLNICGLTPQVSTVAENDQQLHFSILPRRGGLGETALYINGIEVKRYTASALKKNGVAYDLIVNKKDYSSYFVAGSLNPVTVKSWIANNTISSRGQSTTVDKTNETFIQPNIYAVMVGVSDYKGEDLDLQFAAKDAGDISKILSVASRKLLNTDGKEHVFLYDLTTNENRYLLPEKISIKKTFEEIGKKATANDILLVFFAGHGTMGGKEKPQFYFLTADASNSSSVDAIAEVGISTAELTEWIKPSNIKAQKRVLIFDACNSGQIINDFVKLGESKQGYVAARDDEKAQQIKAIEKLNNQSGLIILAASASDQSAYEMGRYSQGILTYSLLRTIKQQADILEQGKYLDVVSWLNATKKMVTELAGETGARQEPQLNSNNNFTIGLVDDQVRSAIQLAGEKPLFARSNFQNADTKIDNLKVRSLIDKAIQNASSQKLHSPIAFSDRYEGPDTYSLNGDYKITGDEIAVSVLVVKGGAEVLHKFETKGNKAELATLCESIVNKMVEWIATNK